VLFLSSTSFARFRILRISCNLFGLDSQTFLSQLFVCVEWSLFLLCRIGALAFQVIFGKLSCGQLYSSHGCCNRLLNRCGRSFLHFLQTPARTQGKAPEVGVLCRPVCARACPNAPRREHERVRCGLGPLLMCCQQDAVAGAARK